METDKIQILILIFTASTGYMGWIISEIRHHIKYRVRRKTIAALISVEIDSIRNKMERFLESRFDEKSLKGNMGSLWLSSFA